MSALRETLTERNRPLLRIPWLTLLDFIGLALAALLVIVQINGQFQESSGRVFVLLLAAFGLNARFFLGQLKSIETLLRKNRVIVLLAPTMAALSTLLIQALSRSYYSGTALVIFIAFWTLWLFIVRMAYRRYTPELRLLLIAPTTFRNEFRNIPRLQLSSLDTPPETFDTWDIVVLDPAETYPAEWLQWLAHADMYGVRTVSAPLVLETLMRRIPINMLHGVWAFEILSGRSSYSFWKRIFDIVAVILASPFILLVAGIVALIVLIDTGKPILFWQERIGKNGKPFNMVKFRTMRTDSESEGAAFATQKDPRVTRTGQFLRKFRLDEIPQFWNVLQGDMSIIGPRPEQKGFANQFEQDIPLYDLRHNVQPGITGWAQVMHGYAADADETKEKLCYDFYYVKHYSLSLDLRIVYQTVLTVLTGFGSR